MSSNKIWKIIGASNHTDKERQVDDFYATDPIAVDKLLMVERPNQNIWECACGEGHLSCRLREQGFTVISSDIVDRGYKDFTYQEDFLMAKQVPFGGKFDIITNPPYKIAKEFVLKSLELLRNGCKAFMFLKLTFLEGKTRFEQIFKDNPPKVVYVFSERIMCAKNAEFQKMKDGGGSCVAYAWFVWEKGFVGTTSLKWI